MPKLSRTGKQAKVSANEARHRKEVALAELRELELAERKGNLIEADQWRDAWVKTACKIRDAVLRIPDKCAPAVSAAASAAEARALLRTECESILRTLSAELETIPNEEAQSCRSS